MVNDNSKADEYILMNTNRDSKTNPVKLKYSNASISQPIIL